VCVLLKGNLRNQKSKTIRGSLVNLDQRPALNLGLKKRGTQSPSQDNLLLILRAKTEIPGGGGGGGVIVVISGDRTGEGGGLGKGYLGGESSAGT